MKVTKESLDTLSVLASSVTSGAWTCADGVIMAGGGRVVARLGSGREPFTQQEVADGEFIAALRNAAPLLLSGTRELRTVNERLLRRVARLESELYGE